MYKVMVVEDSQSEMARIREILTSNDFEVIEANDGQQAVTMAQSLMPNLILMDIVMPEMNGFKATREITRNEATKHIPVVMVSTKNHETDKVWGKRQGAQAYLTKPVYEAELLNVIHTVIG